MRGIPAALSCTTNGKIFRRVSDWHGTLTATASYLGSNTAHLWTPQSVNAAQFLGLGPCTLNGISYASCSTTANTDQRRPLILENPSLGQYFAFVNKIDDGGTGSYHGLVLSVQ